jgi:hypothetical protein
MKSVNAVITSNIMSLQSLQALRDIAISISTDKEGAIGTNFRYR